MNLIQIEIHINCVCSESNQNLIYLKQRFRNCDANSDIVAAEWRFHCYMSQVLGDLVFIQGSNPNETS